MTLILNIMIINENYIHLREQTQILCQVICVCVCVCVCVFACVYVCVCVCVCGGVSILY